jgi:hypothetical protein
LTDILLFVVIGLLLIKLTAVWLIWKRMDLFEDQLDYIEKYLTCEDLQERRVDEQPYPVSGM